MKCSDDDDDDPHLPSPHNSNRVLVVIRAAKCFLSLKLLDHWGPFLLVLFGEARGGMFWSYL